MRALILRSAQSLVAGCFEGGKFAINARDVLMLE
jgi:hypothetical protein